MSNPKLPKLIREVLVELKNTDYIITGSYALLLQGLLDRTPKDLDIISDSPLLLNKLNEICLNMDNVFETISQTRFLFQRFDEELFIDVFPKTKLNNCKEIEWDEFKVKVLNPREIYLNKLQKFYKTPKTRDDLISYFKQLNNQ